MSFIKLNFFNIISTLSAASHKISAKRQHFSALKGNISFLSDRQKQCLMQSHFRVQIFPQRLALLKKPQITGKFLQITAYNASNVL